jgi:hypothetical protein
MHPALLHRPRRRRRLVLLWLLRLLWLPGLSRL